MRFTFPKYSLIFAVPACLIGLTIVLFAFVHESPAAAQGRFDRDMATAVQAPVLAVTPGQQAGVTAVTVELPNDRRTVVAAASGTEYGATIPVWRDPDGQWRAGLPRPYRAADLATFVLLLAFGAGVLATAAALVWHEGRLEYRIRHLDAHRTGASLPVTLG